MNKCTLLIVIIVLAFACSEKASNKETRKKAAKTTSVEKKEKKKEKAAKPKPPPPWEFDQEAMEEDIEDAITKVRKEEGLDNIWADMIYITSPKDDPEFHNIPYKRTAKKNNWYPASTIKPYTDMAVLEWVNKKGYSIRDKVTFYTACTEGDEECTGEWQEEGKGPYRISSLINRSLRCSNNQPYTLTLRLLGIDKINEDFFNRKNGFKDTTVAKGYAGGTASEYFADRAQKIVLEHDGEEIVIEHKWSGKSPFPEGRECEWELSDDELRANCTSHNDMTEFFKRLMYHEFLDDTQRYDVRLSDLKFMRDKVMDNLDFVPDKKKHPDVTCGGATWAKLQEVIPDATCRRKGGRSGSTGWRSEIQHVCSPKYDYCYIFSVSMLSKPKEPLIRVIGDVARVIHQAHIPTH